jgi:CheY-like chemotaxis protein
MGGTIGARSQPGHGSTFWFELNLEAAHPDTPTPARDRHTPATDTHQPEHAPIVLVVDDNPVNQTVAVRTLERCGFRAAVATDGRQALHALQTAHYDAVLMDCQMPIMNGYEATTELRHREQGTNRHTPVIAMTASAMTGDRELCLQAGMDDYVTKPIRASQLAQVSTTGSQPQEPANKQTHGTRDSARAMSPHDPAGSGRCLTVTLSLRLSGSSPSRRPRRPAETCPKPCAMQASE